MKNKIIGIILIIISVISLTGCKNNTNDKERVPKEVSINSAYIVDYDNKNYLGNKDKAELVIIFDISPKKEILLENKTLSMKIDDKTITGKEYKYANLIIYDSSDSIEIGASSKIAYLFEMEKYMYKDNEIFNIEYSIGTQKGEFSYVIKDKASLNKKDIKEVDLLEDIVKHTYSNNSTDALMISSLKWKIDDVIEKYNGYKNLDFYNQTNYQCYDWGAVKVGQKILNYFAEEEKNNISISNSGFLNMGNEKPEKIYDLPPLNYDTLEKYYPGIKEQLIKLNALTNDYAKGLMNVKESGQGTCFRDITIKDIYYEVNAINKMLINKK